MQCPICHVELRLTERQGVEIDYCPRCRGVWLDRGELDKILERAAAGAPSERVEPRFARPHDSDWDHPHEYPKHSRKRRSFLDDLFDFD